MIGKAVLIALGIGAVWAVNKYLWDIPSWKQGGA